MSGWTQLAENRVSSIEQALGLTQTAVDYVVDIDIVLTTVSQGFQIAETVLDGEPITLGKTYLLVGQNDNSENGVYNIVSLLPTVIKRNIKFKNVSDFDNKKFQKKGTTRFFTSSIATPITIVEVYQEPFNIASNFIFNFVAADWVSQTINIPYATHQKINPKLFEFFEKVGNNLNSIDGVEYTIDQNFNISLQIGENASPFDGRVSFYGVGNNLSEGFENIQLGENGKILFGNIALDKAGALRYEKDTKTFFMEHNNNGTIENNASFPPNP